MPKYQVLVTGCAYVEVEADNCDDAEAEAGRHFNVLDMQFDFVCEEADELLYCDEPTNDDEVEK
jgi:hypothetical protein